MDLAESAMNPDRSIPWQERGARVEMRAKNPRRFIHQHVSPLFYRDTRKIPGGHAYEEISSEEQFWTRSSDLVLGAVDISKCRITDWFPRAPGVYWSPEAKRARDRVWSGPSNSDAELGEYFSPASKEALIELGGIGSYSRGISSSSERLRRR